MPRLGTDGVGTDRAGTDGVGTAGIGTEGVGAPTRRPATRVLIAEDPEMLRQALTRLLAEGCDAPKPPPAAAEQRDRAGDGPLDRMTPRERQVLELMAQGRSNAGIAAALVLSHSAVAKHINSIFTKLDIPPTERDNRRVLAVLTYLHTGVGR